MGFFRIECLFICTALLMSCLAPAIAAPPETFIVIVSSNAKKYKPGQTVSLGKTIVLEDKQRVRILLPSGATKVLDQAKQYRVEELIQGEPLGGMLLDRIAKFLSDANAYRPGAQRGYNEGFDTIPLSPPSDVCIRTGAQIKLKTRVPVAGAILSRNGDPKHILLPFATRSAAPDWPKQIPRVDGGQYSIRIKSEVRTFTVHYLDAQDIASDDIVRILHGKGCGWQAAEALSHLMGRNRETP